MDAERLRRALEAVVAHLEHHGVSYVRDLTPLLQELRHPDANNRLQDLRARVKSHFGGMGTLNDIRIARLNGDIVDDELEANRTLSTLRHRLWEAVVTGG